MFHHEKWFMPETELIFLSIKSAPRSCWRLIPTYRDMSDPWGQRPNKNLSGRGGGNRGGGQGWLYFLIAAIAIAVAVWYLDSNFPDALNSEDGLMRFGYLAALLLLVTSGFTFFRRQTMSKSLRHMAIWVGIALILAIGYSFRDEVSTVGARLRAELTPSKGAGIAPGIHRYRAAKDGHFYLRGQINGTPVTFMLDTGASAVVLTKTDALRIGISLEKLKFNIRTSTANGTVYSARTRIGILDIGTISMNGVPAMVNGGRLHISLLGMSFLRRLTRYEVSGNLLTLYQ